MESRVKPRLDGSQAAKSQVKDDGAEMSRLMRICDMILRLIALATTLAAATVIGTAKRTKIVNIQVSPTLPPLPIKVMAKTAYASAFVYFLIANVIACAYSAISLATSILKRARKSNLGLSLSIIDVAMVALLFSGNGAALTFGLLGKHGNSHLQWQKVCNVFGRFCLDAAVSILVSLLGSLAYVLLVLLALVSLHKRSP